MDWLARFSLRNRALTALLTIFAMVAGGWATGSLRQELFPSLQLPLIGVVTVTPGANASVVEERVTKPVEAALLGVRGVENIESTSRAGLSLVRVELQFGSDIGQTQTDAQRAILNVRDLPDDASPQVFAGSIDDFPIIQFSVAGGSDRYDLLNRVRTVVVPEVEDIPGVRDAEASGVDAQVIQIDVDAQKAAQRRVSPLEVADVLKDNGVQIPGGTLADADTNLDVQIGSGLSSVEEVRSLPLPTMSAPAQSQPQASLPPGAAGAPTQPSAPASAPTLGDIASVELTDPEAASITRTDGQPSLSVSIVKRPDGNTVEISRALKEMIPQLEKDMGGGSIEIVFDNAPFIEESVADLGTEGMLGLGFAVVVVFLFLMSLRMTLVTAVSIPLSLLIALLGLKVGGFTLNIITLGALTITVGRVVDDSIVVIENIQRHMSLGEAKMRAIVTAVKEVAGAITSSTFTTVAVFLPLAIVGDMVGELFRPFALTVTLAMLASLFVSLTIVPVLAYWFLKSPDATPASGGLRAHGERATAMQHAYLPTLRWALAHKVLTLLAGVGILVASGLGATLLKTDFLGSFGGNTLTLQQTLPAGTSLEATDTAAKVIESELEGRDEVVSQQVSIGGSQWALFTGGGSNTATFSITLDEDANPAAMTTELQEWADARPELGRVSVSASSRTMDTDVEVVVTAPDPDTLRVAAERIRRDVAALDTVRGTTSDLVAKVPTVTVTVDRAKARAVGLSETAVGGAVAAALRGQNLGQVTIGTLGHDVILRLKDQPVSVAELKELAVAQDAQGKAVTLADVAEVQRAEVAATLTRSNGQRAASITATPTSDDLGAVTTQLRQIVADADLPTGAKATIGGVSQDQSDSFVQLGLALAVAIAITYAILVATFGSLLQPLILMVSVPFAATGAIGLLLATDTPLGLPAMIGVLMLVGIVVTNAIVLIDLVNKYRERGLSVREAVLEGARHRLRPIVMTALATVLALTPMALAITGGGAFISQPLAIVVVGGLVSSTLLTLILVPVLYELVEGFRERRAARAGR